MRRCLHMLLLAVLVASASAPVHARDVLHDTRVRASDAELRAALEALRRRHGVPGLAAAVFDRDNARVFGVGALNADGVPVTPDSRFRSGQVSLLFAGIAVAELVADGSIPEDAALGRVAPEIDLHNPWSGERPVRVADLVSHRAGLGATHFRDVYAAVPEQPLLAGINRAFRALRLESRPGDQEHYSVVGHTIGAYLVEKAAGMPYEDVLSRLLFRPLESTATLSRPAGPLSSDSTGHAGWPARATPALPLNLAVAGDVWISAADLARVGQLLLNRGRHGERQVLHASAVEWMESSGEDAAQVPGARRGVMAEELDGFLFYTQTGALPGFLTRIAYSPVLGRGYAVMLNHGGARAALADADALLRGQILHGTRPAVPAAGQPGALELESLAGWYRDITPDVAPRALHRAWLGLARANVCDQYLCFRRPLRTVRLEAFDAERLRVTGHWLPGWALRTGEAGATLVAPDAQWRRVAGGEVALRVLAAAFVLGGLGLGLVLIPVWSWSLIRRRITRYHELVPRLVPLAAVLAVVTFQALLFSVDYPALGRVGAPSVAILIVSVLAPLLAVLALPAAVAGFFWGLRVRSASVALYLALAAGGASLAMALHGLVAFQTWNY